MEIPFPKQGSILRSEGSSEKDTNSFYGEEFKMIPFFYKQIKFSVLKKTPITDTIETAKKLRHFFMPLRLLLIKLSLISFFDSAIKPLM